MWVRYVMSFVSPHQPLRHANIDTSVIILFDLCCYVEKGLLLLKQIFSILRTIKDNVFSVMVPVIKSDEDFRLITLFDYAEDQLCAYILKICNCRFTDLEVTLLDELITGPDALSLLVSRIWCQFIKYCCSPKICYLHCTALVALYFRVKYTVWVQLLINQLFNILPLEDKNRFLGECYSDLKVIFPECSLFNSEDNKPPALEVNETICLNSYFDDSTKILKRVFELERSIICSGNKKFTEILPTLIVIACCHLHASAKMVSSIQGAELLQILDVVYIFWTSEVYDVQMSVVEFLKSFNFKFIEPCDEREEIFAKFSKLYAEALCSTDRLLQKHALDTYYKFSQTTPHERVIKSIVRNVPHMLQEVQSYLIFKSNEDLTEDQQRLNSIKNMLLILHKKPSSTLKYGSKAHVLSMLLPETIKDNIKFEN